MTSRQRAKPGTSDAELRGIMRAIRVLVAILGQSARTVEQRTGVTNAQLFVLQYLSDSGAHSINDIAAAALTQQSAASVVVTRLQRGRLVTRVRSLEDARRVEVAITASGRRLLRNAPASPTTRLLEALRQVPAAKRRALGAGLTSLLALLGTDDSSEPVMLFEPVPRTRRERTIRGST